MKLIFLDIDGTLTEPGKNTPPASALEAIRKTREKGNKVFLCTGRNPDMLAPLLRYPFDGFIGCAGGYIVVGDQVVYDMPMEEKQTKLALETLHRGGVFCTIEAKDGSFGDDDLSAFLEGQAGDNSEIQRWREALAGDLNIMPMSCYDGRPIYKVVIMCLKEEQLAEAREALEEDFAFCLQEVKAPACINGELINRKFDKGRAVKRVCEALHVDIEDSYGFGDSMNDLEMIRTVGRSICMANGAEALKKMADLVAPSVAEDGLAKAFEELGLV